jgi:predicted MFS family arabinose efflux permease
LNNSLSRPLLRLIIGHVCLHGAMAGMRMAAPLWALKEGFSAAAVGVLLALFALMQVFLALPAGRYADAHGLKKPVGFAIVMASSGALLATAFPHFATLCIAALCVGGATGIASIALQRHVGRAAENPLQLKQVFSWLSIGPAASNFLGPFSAGLLIDFAGFRAAFFMMALLPLVTWFWIRKTTELPPVEVKKEANKKAWDLLREPLMRRLMLVNWLLSSCWDVHTFVVPILGHERGYSASVIGTILGAFAIAAAAVRVLLPVLAHSLREWAVITVAMVLTAMLFAVYPLMPTALSMGVCSVFLGFTLGCVQPMIMSTLHQITPEDRHGEALGLRLMAINGSSVLMPMLFGLAGAVVGVAGLFWVTGACVGAGSWVAAKLKLG